MVGVRSAVVVRSVAAEAGVRRGVVVAVVTGGAVVGDVCVSTVQWIKIVVDLELRRHPIRRCGVAHRTVVRDVQGHVVRVRRAVEIGRVAAVAVGWRGRIIAVDVASGAII